MRSVGCGEVGVAGAAALGVVFDAALDGGSSSRACGAMAGMGLKDGAACAFGAGTGVEPVVSQSLGASSVGCSGKRVNGTRPELGEIAPGPAMPLFGAFHDTTSSTSAA
ncbi:hypothetical protein D3C86_1827500 [compost metagenome]